jgi:hypothetical protein
VKEQKTRTGIQTEIQIKKVDLAVFANAHIVSGKPSIAASLCLGANMKADLNGFVWRLIRVIHQAAPLHAWRRK